MAKRDWILLWDFCCSMKHYDSPYRFMYNHEQLIKNVLISGKVPTRGMATGAYQRIETYFTQDAEISIIGSHVTVVIENAAQPPFRLPRRMTFERVQIDRAGAVEWINENALETDKLPAGFDETSAIATEPKKAPEADITSAIKTAYDNAERNGEKPPNIAELPKYVKPLLEEQGYQASGTQIQRLGKSFKDRRRPSGKTLRSERLAQERDALKNGLPAFVRSGKLEI
jgi:hypothetical protein